MDGENYQAYGCPFVYVGAQEAKFKLYDIKVIGTLDAQTKKANYIQMLDTAKLKVDDVHSYFWDYNKVPSWEKETGKKGCWCYKKANSTTGQKANAEVPLDTEFPAGTGFLCLFENDGIGLGLQFNGQVYKPQASEMDDKGYITITKQNDTDAFFLFSNPFPVEISLADIYVCGTLDAQTKKANYIQYMALNKLKVDDVRSYFWDYNKTSSVTGEKGCWCFKKANTTTGQKANAEVTDAASRKIKPGEGFLCLFETSGIGLGLKVKVPESIKSL